MNYEKIAQDADRQIRETANNRLGYIQGLEAVLTYLDCCRLAATEDQRIEDGLP